MDVNPSERWLAGCLVLAGILAGSGSTEAVDWPTWGRDAAHSLYSPERIPEPLRLRWVLDLRDPRPAWAEDTTKRLLFDHHYEPILLRGRLYVPSMISDRLSCYDADTGAELWRFYANGPIRLGATGWEDRIFFSSDDGYLYCLDAESGDLNWKFRGGPADRVLLGNGRMISSWAARGAPVVRDGTVYFSASIWPLMGVFIHAVDARTGERIWTNDGTGARFTEQQHSSPAFAGVAPQGYLAATEDHLIVAGGRTVPAVFRRKDGELLSFNLSSRRMGTKGTGGYGVVALESSFVVGGGIYRSTDGRFIASVDADVLAGGVLIGKDADGLCAFATEAKEVERTDRRGRTTKRTVIPKRWTIPLDVDVEEVFIQCGDRIYCRGRGNTIFAVDASQPELEPEEDSNSDSSSDSSSNSASDSDSASKSDADSDSEPEKKKRSPVWSAELPGEARSMIAGDGRLFVSTDAGRIYCFGVGETTAEMPAPRTVRLVAKGAAWKYRDDGKDPAPNWPSASFDDSGWASGPGLLGYGDDRVATKLSYGPDEKQKTVTYYFRRQFEVPVGLRVASGEIRALVDDGAAFYLGGREMGRLFLPDEALRPSTLANQGTDGRTYYRVKLPADAVHPGRNTVAVEVHQRDRTSSDVLFDLELVVTPRAPEPLWDDVRDVWSTRAKEILDLSGARDGYALVIGLGSGRLAAELARQSSLDVIVVEPDRERLDAFRRHMDEIGAYGTRVAAIAASFRDLELPAYFAELIVTEAPDAEAANDTAFVARVFHSLRPSSGVALLPTEAGDYKGFARAAVAGKLDRGAWSHEEGYAMLRRTGPPTGSADWTHQHADAANSVVSRDTVVKAPFQVLWFGGPSNADVLPRHGHGPVPHVVGGRLFIEGRDMLRATDIYTGRLLWQRELTDVGKYYDNTSHEPGANALGSNYVSLPDGVYILHRDRCLRLDPASGKTISVLALPGAAEKPRKASWGFLAARDDVLIAGGWPTDFASPEFDEQSLAYLKGYWLRYAAGNIRQLKNFEAISYEDALSLYPPETEDDAFRDEDEEDEDSGDTSSGSGSGRSGRFGRFTPVISDSEWQAHTEDEHRTYLLANLNKLLLEEDMLAKIPERTGFGRRGGSSRRGSTRSGSARSGNTGSQNESERNDAAGDGDASGSSDSSSSGTSAATGTNESAGSETSTQSGSQGTSETDRPGGETSTQSGSQGTSGTNRSGSETSTQSGSQGSTRTGRGGRRWPTMKEIGEKLVKYLAEPNASPNTFKALELKREILNRRYRFPAYGGSTPGKFGNAVRAGSRLLYALDRHSGEVLWVAPARHNFRHSAIAVGRNAVFGIDRMTSEESSYYRRRGKPVNEGASVVALDLRTGEVLWRDTERVFGTWLGYSVEHDVLIQAGANGPDRPRDEVRTGIIAYRGTTGDVLWETGKSYSGPCLLLGRRLITQGYSAPGFALDLLTGEPIRASHPISGAPVDWGYTRKYGCNTVIGSPNLLTFRSAAAGYYDLLADCGTANLGGIRSGCTSNLIPAGGILNAPDYTRTCTCSYQNQVSAAFIHAPDASSWSFSPYRLVGEAVERVGFNLGAPGDHRGPDDTLWLDLPSVGGESPDLPVELVPHKGSFEFPRHHESWIEGGQLRWVAASGLCGDGEITVHVHPPDEIVIANEVVGKSALRVTGAIVSESAAPTAEAEGVNPVSLGGGFAPSPKFNARVAGYAELASESVTVELWVQADGDHVFVRAGGSTRGRQGFVIRGMKPTVTYYVTEPNEQEEEEADGDGQDGQAGGGGNGRRGQRGSEQQRAGDDEPFVRRTVTIESEEKIPRGRWTHLAFTYDACVGSGSLYLNGKLVARDEGQPAQPLWWDDSAPDLVLGDLAEGSARFSELRVTDRALAPAEFLIGADSDIEPWAVIGHWRVGTMSRPPADERPYTVRLVFSELDDRGPGERRFNVHLQGRRVLEDFDIAAAAGGSRRALTREFVGVPIGNTLRVRLQGVRGEPLLSGIQLLAE